MPELTVSIVLVPAESDPPLKSPEYEAELELFEGKLRAAGLDPSVLLDLKESIGSGEVRLGQFFIDLAQNPDVQKLVAAAVGAWLHKKYGRRVKLKVGRDGVEAEASTVDEVERLVSAAQEYQDKQESPLHDQKGSG